MATVYRVVPAAESEAEWLDVLLIARLLRRRRLPSERNRSQLAAYCSFLQQ
jgi:hypothetical protein